MDRLVRALRPLWGRSEEYRMNGKLPAVGWQWMDETVGGDVGGGNRSNDACMSKCR